MDPKSMKKWLNRFSEEQITCRDEAHIKERVEERGIPLEFVKRNLLNPIKLNRVIKERKSVYRLYFKLSGRRTLVIIIDFLKRQSLNIRTFFMVYRHWQRRIRGLKGKWLKL